MTMIVTSKIIRAYLLYKFKLGTKAAQAIRNIRKAFKENIVTNRTKLKKFSFDDKTFEDEPQSRRRSVINNELE